MLWQVLVRNVPPDPDESVNDHVEHFFCVNHPDHYLCHQVSIFSCLDVKFMNICKLLFDAEVKETIRLLHLKNVMHFIFI